MKRYKLKTWVKVLIAVVGAILLFMILKYAINNYLEYLEKCDLEKGYTCNFFGK